MLDYIMSFLSTCPIPKDYINIHFGCRRSLLVLLFLCFFGYEFCAFLCSTCFYLGPVNVSVDIFWEHRRRLPAARKKKAHAPFSNQCCSCTNNCNVFFRPVGCIFVGYVISSILLPYLPLVCVRLILGAMGTDESH